MKKQKVTKTTNSEGNEVLTLMDENDASTGFQITMESIFEERPENEELSATSILSSQEVESLKAPPKKSSRLEFNNAHLIEKSTGVKMVIKSGNIPKLSDRIEKDITGSFLSIAPETADDTFEPIFVLVPYKKDGTIPENFQYTVVEETENDERIH